MPTRDSIIESLTGIPLSRIPGKGGTSGPKRPNLGPAVKPREGIKRYRESLLGRLQDWINVRRRDSLIKQRKQEDAKNELRKQLGAFGGVRQKFQSAFGDLFTKAAQALQDVTSKLLGADRPLFDEPVKDLRKRPSKETRQETAGGVDMIGVNSTNVFSVGWDQYEDRPNMGMMTIQFRRESRVYEYDDTPEWMFKGLLSTPSPGRYVWAFVRAAYDHTNKYRRVA